jgi:hypothetical protein
MSESSQNVGSKKFFVKVIAPNKSSLAGLRKYHLDLFKPTATIHQEDKFSIEGLLSLDQIGMLTENGYQVVVEEEAAKRSRSKLHAVTFKEWIKGMEV